MNKQEITAHFIDNMERERTKLGLTQGQMAKELGLSLSGYKKLIAGETTKIDLCLAVRLHELSGRYLIDLCGVNSPASEFAKRLPELSESQFRFVSDVVEFEADFRAAVPNAEDFVTLMIPTGNFEDGMVWDSVHLEKVNVAAYRRRFGEDLHCAIKVSSNHLHPVYHKGDILLVSKQPPRDGDIGIFVNRVTGCGYLRKFHQTSPVRLEPINGYGLEFVVNPEDETDMNQWIKFGKVLTKMRQQEA